MKDSEKDRSKVGLACSPKGASTPARPSMFARAPRAAWPPATSSSPSPYHQRDSDRTRATAPNPRPRQDGASAGLANRRPSASRLPACHGSAPPTLFRPFAEKAEMPPTSRVSARSPNPRGSPSASPARQTGSLRRAPPKANRRRRPPGAPPPLPNGVVGQWPPRPSTRRSRPYPFTTGAPPRPSAPPRPYKREPPHRQCHPLPPPAPAPPLSPLRPAFSFEPPLSPRAAAKLPWSSPPCATPTLRRLRRHPQAASPNPTAACSSARY